MLALKLVCGLGFLWIYPGNSRTIRSLIRMSLTISRNLTTKMYQGPTHHHVDPSSSLITTPPHHPHTQSPAIIPTGISSHPTPPPSQLRNEDVEVSDIEVTTDQRRPAAVLELPSRSESVSSHSATTYVPQRMSRLAVSMPGAGCRVYFAGWRMVVGGREAWRKVARGVV